ncbi:MAG: SpoIVB peptidase [Hydrogenibacillus schlegelii]|uniref:SpoIVB peptidase n=1 Tax=Hydrogenibacillus schlegelii TaxID=1484 RepID=A0A947GAW6_HYDSH|nr:SpoIVB peptidase [Hydrogenibacillus schlegelii]
MQRDGRWRPNRVLVGVFVLLILVQTPLFAPYFTLAPEKRLFAGTPFSLPLPPLFRLASSDPSVIDVFGDAALEPRAAGKATVDVRLGALPVARMNVRVFPELRVYPGGQSIGVKLKTDGVLVVGYKKIVTADGRGVSPAEDAAIRVGDRIKKVDGKPLKDAGELGRLIEAAGRAGRPMTVELARGEDVLTVTVRPLLDPEDNSYKLGLFVRDSAAGVGTLTFYDPNTRIYGALGHVISDLDTRRPIAAGGGVILPSTVSDVDRGWPGRPGAIRAIFPEEGKKIGDIEKNTPFGIFGRLTAVPSHPLFRDPLPVAPADEVHPGPAKILTVVEGDRIEAYAIEIESVFRQDAPSTKSMIIRVTDPRLLEKTGGIVQGMSGSPILQDDRLAGAVTHVFVSDSARGYGVFIEWMLRMTDLIPEVETAPEESPARAA